MTEMYEMYEMDGSRIVTEADIHYMENTIQEIEAKMESDADDPTESPRKQSRRSTRPKTLTTKGMEYVLMTKENRRQQAFKKLYKQTQLIKSRLIEEGNLSEMRHLYSLWKSMFESFLDEHEDYCTVLTEEERLADHKNWFEQRKFDLLNFKKSVDNWFVKADSEALEQNFTSTKHEFGKLVKPEDSISQATFNASSHHSVRSQHSSVRSSSKNSARSSITSVRLREEQKQAELEAKAAQLKKKQALEKIKLEIKMEEEEMELQSELAISKAKTDVLNRYERQQTEQTHRSNVHFHPNQNRSETKMEDVNNTKRKQQTEYKVPYQSSPQLYKYDSRLNPNVSPFHPIKKPLKTDQKHTLIETEIRPSMTSPLREHPRIYPVTDSGSGHPSHDIDHASDDGSFRSKQSEDIMWSIVKHLKKPATDIKKFGGDPLEYKKFIRQFETKVVINTDDNDERMNFLEQYTYGEANKIVSGYGYLDAGQGYNIALKELQERYGDPNIIVNAYIRKALDWPIIKGDNAKALDEYSIFLSECQSAVHSMEAIKILEYSENLRRIVSKLPYHLHDRWRSIVQENHDRGQLASFSQLVKFVKSEAKKANDPIYGKIAMTPDTQVSKAAKPHDRKSVNSKRTKGSFATKATPAGDKGIAEEAETVTQKHKSASSEVSKKTPSNKICHHCNSSAHSLETCSSFLKLSPPDRSDVIKAKGLCYGCLKPGHLRKRCLYKSVCTVCQKFHPTVLHVDLEINSDHQNSSLSGKPEQKEVHTTASVSMNDSFDMGAGDCEGECTLAIIPVRIKRKNGLKEVQTYAFLDPGSSVSFCTESLMREIGGSGRKMKITLDTMGSPYTMHTYAVNGIEVSGLTSNNPVHLSTVYTKDTMPVSQRHIPTSEDISKWSHLVDLHLPQIDAEIGLLIGNNVPDAYTPLEVRSGPVNSPHATKTPLGWIVWNVIRKNSSSTENIFPVNHAELVCIQNLEEQSQLNRLVKQSIDMDFPERLIDDKRENSQEDKCFLDKVTKSIQYVDGHYQIDLPFRNDSVILPDNKQQANQRLRSLEKKLRKNSKFHEDYVVFMNNIISKGYAEKVPQTEVERHDGKVWYIPHHGVYHKKKKDKIRVVFDCAASFQGISLNQVLLQGPDLTNNLFGVLTRFRQQQIGLMADVESMYYQVKVPKKDCDYLRFLWWSDGDLDKEPEVFRMLVHIFGAVSSPSCANFALHQTAYDNMNHFDVKVTNTVLRSFYVDDCLTSTEDENEAILLANDLSNLCSKGGFHLTKWVSNSHSVLKSIPMDERAKEIRHLDLGFDVLPAERALGVYWSIETDTLGFQVSMQDKPPTRRVILSSVTSIFDPLGLAAPFVLPARILLQSLCRKGLTWDEPVAGCDLEQWTKWLQDLPKLANLILPRCYKPIDIEHTLSCELHHFSDASEVGYGIVTYLRFVDNKGAIFCSFLTGKARVAPLKKISIPRMELTAATVAVRIDKKLRMELDYKIDHSTFWTDSKTVLRYIANDVTRFHTFVANRLAVIHDGSNVNQWRFVNSDQNPADDASRGLTMTNFLKNKRWFSGPEYLYKAESYWPTDNDNYDSISDVDPEVKHPVTSVCNVESQLGMDILISHFSKWSKLKRIAGWFLMARRNLHSRINKKSTEAPNDKDLPVNKTKTSGQKIKVPQVSKKLYLPTEIIQEAENSLYKYVQNEYFRQEILSIQQESNVSVKKSSDLYKLDPIIVDGILRVGGRLDKALLPYDAKHQIILPKDSKLSHLVLENIHKETGHLGKMSMLTKLRQKYWIINANSIIKKITSKCVVCRKYRARCVEQKMADLPEDRVLANEPPFSHVGMDYFGPIEVKRGRSTVKRYGVIFTCLSIRAVHIEAAQSLTTDSCINAIRRFISRRGPVKVIRSDNGTNLVGSEKELCEEIEKWNKFQIHDVLQQKGILWKFNPPGGSHFGGVWECLIRSIRKIMYGLLKEQVIHLDDEALSTLFCEIESILNNRPITKVSEDPNDLEALTPNHLLLIRSGQKLPCGEFDKSDNYARRRWRQIQYLAEIFWTRWSKEYLPCLQERQKWNKIQRNLAVGDIVLVVDNSPRNAWMLGKIVSVNSDKKGLVRSVQLKTQTSTLQRPVDKLCLILENDLS